MPRAAQARKARPLRREPQARSLATRRRLLDAAVAELVDRGHGRLTTPQICARAGVSQGALFKHFATKAELIGAAVGHLFAGLVDDYHRAFARAAEASDRVATALQLLWDRFAQPELLAAFELYTAARTDPEIAAALEPVMARHQANLRQAARDLFPEAASNPDFDAAVELVLSALQGLALGGMARPDKAAEARQLAMLEAFARDQLEVSA